MFQGFAGCWLKVSRLLIVALTPSGMRILSFILGDKSFHKLFKNHLVLPD